MESTGPCRDRKQQESEVNDIDYVKRFDASLENRLCDAQSSAEEMEEGIMRHRER